MNLKKVFALLLALTLVLSLAACGGTSGSAASETAQSASAETASSAEEQAEEPQTEEQVEEAMDSGLTAVDLPLTDEPTTFSIYFSQPDMFNQWLDSPADNPCFQELAARTNVSLDFMVVSNDAEADRFKVLAASGSLPDLVMSGSSLYTGGGSKGVEDGVFFNLVDYQEYMPNYFHFVNLNSEFKSLLSSDGGNIVDAVYSLNYPANAASIGLVIRSDWLSDLGLSMPSTYDEYHDVLTAFKNDKNASAPLQISHELSNQVWAMGFGTNCAISDHDNTYDWFGAIDGEVVFWPATSNFRNYLETMQTWYAEGLIDAEFMSRTGGNTADRELVADGSSGLWWSTLGDFGGFTANDANAVFEAAPTPSKDGNYTGAMIPAAMIRDRTCLNISTNCEQPELAAAYLDYMYSEDGQLLSNYGVEGKTFEYDADGNPQFTEFVTNSETGFDASLTMILYGLGNFPSAFNPQRYYNDTQTAALDTWGAYAGMDTGIQGMSAALNLSGEDATTAAGLLSDIMTYVRETTFKVICNQATMDDYDQMVKDLEGMDLGTVLELYQASYDANFK